MPGKFDGNSRPREGGLCESRIDGLIERLVSAPAVTCGRDFADRAIAAAKSADARADAVADALLKASPLRLGADFEQKTMLACRKAGEGARSAKARALASLSAAACAALAVIGAANSHTSGARDAIDLRGDYAKISDMTREISDLSVFIVQEDFFDAIQAPRR